MKSNETVGRVISILSNQLKRQMDLATANKGTTGVQDRILHYILAQSNDRELFQKDIEAEFNLRCSTATGTLKLMEKNGLIKRISVPYDARLKKIVVTEKGLLKKKQVLEDISALEEKLKQNISKEDLQIFFQVINQMSENLQ